MLSAMPNEHLQHLIRQEAKAFPDLTIETVTGTLDEVVEYARTTPLDIFEIILSRGGMARALREVLPIPVIPIHFTSAEILSALDWAISTHRPFAVVGHQSTVDQVKSLWQALQYQENIQFVPLAEHELTPGVQRLKEQGVDLIVGDIGAVRTAQDLGMNFISIPSTAQSIKDALDRVARYAEDTWQLRRELSLARQVSDLSQNALLVLNDQHIIVFSNQKARRLDLYPLLRQLWAESQKQSLTTEQFRQIYKIGNHYYTFVMDQSRSARHSYSLISITPLDDIIKESHAIRVESGIPTDSPLLLQPRTNFFKQVSELSSFLHTHNDIVLLWGEPGTEQVELARYFARSSAQAGAPLIFVECAALSPQDWQDYISSELLAHYSSGCIILFNGIQDLSPELQGRLTITLAQNPILTRRYLIFSTCTGNPHRLAAEGKLSTELYRILSRHSIRIPSLDEQRETIPQLIERYCYRYRAKTGQTTPSFTPQAIALLQKFHWFLDMELFRTVMDRLIAAPQNQPISEVEVQTVLDEVSRKQTESSDSITQVLQGSLAEMEQTIIRQVLKEEGMNHSRAAKRLGISRSTLWRKLGGESAQMH